MNAWLEEFIQTRNLSQRQIQVLKTHTKPSLNIDIQEDEVKINILGMMQILWEKLIEAESEKITQMCKFAAACNYVGDNMNYLDGTYDVKSKEEAAEELWDEISETVLPNDHDNTTMEECLKTTFNLTKDEDTDIQDLFDYDEA